MNPEEVFQKNSQSTNENDIEQQTFVEIKNRSEKVIKQKYKDDSVLNNLQRELQETQKSIEEKAQQILNSEKEGVYLKNVLEEFENIRGTVETDVNKILTYSGEYLDIFNGLKVSVQEITTNFNQNKETIDFFTKEIANYSTNYKLNFQQKLQQINDKQKLLHDQKESIIKMKTEQLEYLKNRKESLLNLDKEEQDLLEELKILQNKGLELEKEIDSKNTLKKELINDLKNKQDKYNTALKAFEMDKFKRLYEIEQFETICSNHTKKKFELREKLEDIGNEYEILCSSIEEIKKEILDLEEQLVQLENAVEIQEIDEDHYKQLIEKLRSDSSTIIENNEQLLENLNKRLHDMNSSKNEYQLNLAQYKKILDNMKIEDDLVNKEIALLQNQIKDLTENIQENEAKYVEVIDSHNEELNIIKSQNQSLLIKKDELIQVKENIAQMLSELQSKKIATINESVQIESNQNICIDKINEEIASLRKVLAAIKEESENMKNQNNQSDEITMEFKKKRREIFEDTNKYKERMEMINKKADDAFNLEKNKLLDKQTKMELQISELKIAEDNLRSELMKINRQIMLQSKNPATVSKPSASHQRSSGIKITQNKKESCANKKPNIPKKDKNELEWTTEEEEYNPSKKNAPKNTLQISQKKKENVKRVQSDQIESTDSSFGWIQPSANVLQKRKRK